jgi:hypothetical protein
MNIDRFDTFVRNPIPTQIIKHTSSVIPAANTYTKAIVALGTSNSS